MVFEVALHRGRPGSHFSVLSKRSHLKLTIKKTTGPIVVSGAAPSHVGYTH